MYLGSHWSSYSYEDQWSQKIVRGPQAAKCWNAIFIFKRKIKNKDGLQHFAGFENAFGAIDNLFDGAKKSLFGPVSREDASREGAKNFLNQLFDSKYITWLKT